VCQLGTEQCTETDGAGQFVLGGLPEGRDIEVAFEKEGSIPVLRPLHTGATPVNLRQIRLITSTGVKGLFAKAGTAVDPAKGFVVGIPIAPGEGIGSIVLPEGVVVTLTPSGPAPLYSRGAESPGVPSADELDPALSATRFGGWALFGNVDPGDYALRFERDGQHCSQELPGYGYGADADGNIRLKVVAGYSTGSIAAFCP
jgi:hypothetical protein